MINKFIFIFRDENEETEITMNQLNMFVEDNMVRYLEIVQCYIDNNTSDTAILVRALDRFYRKLQAIAKLFPYKDFKLYVFKIIMKLVLHICLIFIGML